VTFYLKEHSLNSANHFIAGWYIDTDVVDELVPMEDMPELVDLSSNYMDEEEDSVPGHLPFRMKWC
jgi:hypothetical protein